MTLTGTEGWSWHRGLRLVQGSWLYWLVFSARAAICEVSEGCLTLGPGAAITW